MFKQAIPFFRAKIYATWNPSDKGTYINLSNGNLTIIQGSAQSMVRSTISKSSGKWYWEYTANVVGSPVSMYFGIANSSASLNAATGRVANGWGYSAVDGSKFTSGTQSSYGASYGAGDVIGVALDMDAGTLVYYKNNVSQGTAFTGLTGNIFASAGSTIIARQSTANFGDSDFVYTPPSGYNPGLFNFKD